MDIKDLQERFGPKPINGIEPIKRIPFVWKKKHWILLTAGLLVTTIAAIQINTWITGSNKDK